MGGACVRAQELAVFADSLGRPNCSANWWDSESVISLERHPPRMTKLFMNVERAYREFRNAPPDALRGTAASCDAVYQAANAKGIAVEF
jgi:hypothetical protein